MAQLISSSLIFFSLICGAQPHDFDAERTGFNSLTQSGKLVTLVILPSAKLIRFEVVAKEAAAVKFTDDGVEATWGLGKEKQKIKVLQMTDPKTLKKYYVFERPATPLEHLQINIKTEKSKEQFTLPRID